MTTGLWFTGLLSALVIKMSSSIDDVLWLAPFLTTNVNKKVRFQNAAVYLSVCLIQTVVAMGIASSGEEIVGFLTGGNKDAWSTDKILTVGAGMLLGIYSVKLTLEHYFGDDDDEKEGEDSENPETADSDCEKARGSKTTSRDVELGAMAEKKSLVEEQLQFDGLEFVRPRTLSAESREIEAQEEGQKLQKDKAKQQTLFVIAFIGSIDDLTLFVPMLVGKGFDLGQLMSGAFIAASLIVALCMFIGLCKPVANCLSSIPLFTIVIAFATTLLIKGFTTE